MKKETELFQKSELDCDKTELNCFKNQNWTVKNQNWPVKNGTKLFQKSELNCEKRNWTVSNIRIIKVEVGVINQNEKSELNCEKRNWTVSLLGHRSVTYSRIFDLVNSKYHMHFGWPRNRGIVTEHIFMLFPILEYVSLHEGLCTFYKLLRGLGWGNPMWKGQRRKSQTAKPTFQEIIIASRCCQTKYLIPYMF